MPPARRARCTHRAEPYRRGWLPLCSCRDDSAHGNDAGGGAARPVPDDALSPVFARLSSAADVVRCAATCRRWSCLVAKDAAVLSRALPPLPCLTLGFLHQENAGATARRRRTSSSDTVQPRFVPTAAAARLIGLRAPSLTAVAEAVLAAGDRPGLFEHARPVAARNGWLVLELRQERYTDGVKLCVCNPTRGVGVALLPPLAGADNTGDYACALYTGHDLDPPQPLSAIFRLLLVYNRRSFTTLRSYSSDTGRWSREATRSGGPKIASHSLRQLGQSIVVGGVAYWHLRRTAFAVRLDTPAACGDIDPSDYNAPVCSKHLTVAPRAVFCPGSGDDGCSGEWEWTQGRCIRLKQLKVWYQGSRDEKVLPVSEMKINLRWFCEKSGNLLFTLGEGTTSPGAYVLDMTTQHVEKVADDIDCHSWENFIGYEMNGAAYLQSISRH
ncbi:hypothetical protein C2845_PM17G05880 [Panicum miliaceum]|uniref:F-box domain-containing protein n=1 Tax=Panicum miliaceum TaxID=4540 RepID=A0A3L6Q2B9_PANMI|nr:hypothetical protein C2845_PM17G05880 [Panicum miliaceum]